MFLILEHLFISLLCLALVLARATYDKIPNMPDGYEFWKDLWKTRKFAIGFSLFYAWTSIILTHIVPGIGKLISVLIEVNDPLATDLGAATLSIFVGSYFFLRSGEETFEDIQKRYLEGIEKRKKQLNEAQGVSFEEQNNSQPRTI